MSKQFQDQIARGNARIVDAPAAAVEAATRHQVEVDRNFEIPTSFYAGTVGLYLAFLGVMAATFGNPGLLIPMVIFAFFIVAGFGIPTVWVRLKGNESKPLGNYDFRRKGIMTHTGWLAGREAAVQMLILPVLIVLWACAIAVIAALL